ncbi:uncharacterized protein [Palaemon carinicauda]|uniref:uncharacterized protein isoform X2 n=1 Tax=Palaemon carinicauda TaxID=392227 RepID=UPI0035B60829
MATRGCKNSPDTFSYVCGYYIGKKQVLHKIVKGAKLWIAYRLYFGMPMGDQDKPWAPHVICGSCRSTLEGWLRGTGRAMPFAIPRVWREPKNHHDDCFFCTVDVTKYRKVKGRQALHYPDIPSSRAPVPHDDCLPVPQPPENVNDGMDISSEGSASSNNQEMEEVFVPRMTLEPHFPNQSELDDLIRDLGLTKSGAELLSSRLKEWNLLGQDCRITGYRKRHEEFEIYYDISDDLCYCKDVTGLFTALGLKHDPTHWRLFIDSSTRSLKAVLLPNGNKYPSLPLAHSVQKKKNYENVRQLLNKINYDEFKWNVCGDFKMLAFLLGLQGGYTKYSCFLCLWDSRADDDHFKKVHWPPRMELQPGMLNVHREPLVDSNKVLLPPLHIKLGLIKQFVKALDFGGEAFQEIRLMFPKLSEAKIKGGIFVGPQVNTMLKSEKLERAMTKIEKEAWCAFRDVVHGFLGNNKDPNYKQLVAKLIENFRKLGCRMSLKIHFLHSHLDFFPENLGDVSEEQGERFHQDIATMERRYHGRWNTAMMGDYIWSLMREDENMHSRKSRSSKHF